jgi:hypothetical protein
MLRYGTTYCNKVSQKNISGFGRSRDDSGGGHGDEDQVVDVQRFARRKSSRIRSIQRRAKSSRQAQNAQNQKGRNEVVICHRYFGNKHY